MLQQMIMEENRKNKCWKCKYWEECFKYRYGNKRQEYMQKITKCKDDWGEYVIYVQECKKYKYENPEKPRILISDLHNEDIDKINDIIDAVEDYFYDSGK